MIFYKIILNYYYDTGGNVTTTGNLEIASINPFRYRSYYYDKETGFYYLNSRYYNPIWGRFLNVDSVIGANRDILGNNLYAYCSNNPASKIDFNGFSAINLSILGAGGHIGFSCDAPIEW